MSLLTEQELCSALKVDRVFLWKCRQDGMPFIRLGAKIVRYDLEEVLEWFRNLESVPDNQETKVS